MLENILTSLAVVAPIGLILGVLLAVISFKFGVEEDGKVKEIRSHLPGANCGACGFKGCDDYAAAIAEGKAAPNLCVPGGEDVASEIGALLGVDVSAPENKVAFVSCNGNCTATSKKSVYEGITTCRAAAMIYGGPNACNFGCIGLGDCAADCPAQAICIKDGIAHVAPSLCIGCGLCASRCPKKIISMLPKQAYTVNMCSSKDKAADARKACKNACIGCKKCEKTCPHGAITVQDNRARIDYDKCTGCGACVKGCPTGCLKNISFSK